MRKDKLTLRDAASLSVGADDHQPVTWKAKITVRKYHGRAEDGNLEAKPYEVLERDGNLATTAGMTAVLNLLSAEASPDAFSNANAYIAVGSDNTAANIADTTLTTELDRQGMDGVFPTVSGAVCTWQSVFSTAGSDGAWEEWGIFNAAAAGTMLNHKITSLGTKAGGTWTFTVTVTLS